MNKLVISYFTFSSINFYQLECNENQLGQSSYIQYTYLSRQLHWQQVRIYTYYWYPMVETVM